MAGSFWLCREALRAAMADSTISDAERIEGCAQIVHEACQAAIQAIKQKGASQPKGNDAK